VTASVPAIMAIKSHQEPSRAIKSHQEPSRAIKSHQEPSRAIKSHQEPSRAIKGHQGPSRAIKGHQEPFVHPSPIRKLSLYERQHAPRWTSRVDRWKALAWASSHRDLSSSTSRFCAGARVCNQCNQWQSRVLRDSVQAREPRDRRSAIMAIQGNHGNPMQSKAIKGVQHHHTCELASNRSTVSSITLATSSVACIRLTTRR